MKNRLRYPKKGSRRRTFGDCQDLTMIPNQTSDRTLAQCKKPFENWAICYPRKAKREKWQADYSGVTRLSSTKERYRVNVWRRGGSFTLRLTAKNGLYIRTPLCQLLPTSTSQYVGELLLSEKFPLRVVLYKTAYHCLRVHFELVQWRTGR